MEHYVAWFLPYGGGGRALAAMVEGLGLEDSCQWSCIRSECWERCVCLSETGWLCLPHSLASRVAGTVLLAVIGSPLLLSLFWSQPCYAMPRLGILALLRLAGLGLAAPCHATPWYLCLASPRLAKPCWARPSPATPWYPRLA